MKIIVRGTNWIGDAVMSIPALRRLRLAFPDAHITLQTREWAEGLFREADFIDQILKIESGDTRLRSLMRQAAALRRGKFDLGVLMPNSFESAVVAKLGRVRRRFGYSTDGRTIFLSDRVAVPDWKNSRHEVFYYLNLVEAVEKSYGLAGFETIQEPDSSLTITASRKLKASESLAGFGVDLSRPIVMLAAGSKNSRAKRWPVERYAKLGDEIVRKLNANVVLIGAPDETEISSAVASTANEKLIDITGRTDIADVAALISVSDVLISNDMGLAHLAPAVGTSVIVIFGPTNPVTTRPFGLKSHVIRAGVECSPCMLRDCPIDHRCMTRISVDAVFQKARDILESAERK